MLGIYDLCREFYTQDIWRGPAPPSREDEQREENRATRSGVNMPLRSRIEQDKKPAQAWRREGSCTLVNEEDGSTITVRETWVRHRQRIGGMKPEMGKALDAINAPFNVMRFVAYGRSNRDKQKRLEAYMTLAERQHRHGLSIRSVLRNLRIGKEAISEADIKRVLGVVLIELNDISKARTGQAMSDEVMMSILGSERDAAHNLYVKQSDLAKATPEEIEAELKAIAKSLESMENGVFR